jgi:hypothetical protein
MEYGVWCLVTGSNAFAMRSQCVRNANALLEKCERIAQATVFENYHLYYSTSKATYCMSLHCNWLRLVYFISLKLWQAKEHTLRSTNSLYKVVDQKKIHFTNTIFN